MPTPTSATQRLDPERRLSAGHAYPVRSSAAVLLLTILAVLLPATAPVRAATVVPPVPGSDISWPQCPRRGRDLALPPNPAARFVILGANGGSSGFTRNPCLLRQVRWARGRHLWIGVYTIAGLPTPRQLAVHGAAGPFGVGTLQGRLANAGTAEARATITTMRSAGLGRTPVVWLDVENPPHQPWSRSPQLNRAVLRGMIYAYRNHGYRVGIYSYPYGWWQITGGMRPGLPLWIASGKPGPAGALAKCSPAAFTGGRTLLSQWWSTYRGHGADYDLTCPATTPAPPVPWPFYPYRAMTLRPGARHPAVAVVQRALVVRPVSGRFGPPLQAAVVLFQRRHGIPVSGAVTPATWRALGYEATIGRRLSALFTRG